MRELNMVERGCVYGGDGEEGYNEMACQTTVAASALLVGMTSGTQAGSAAGVVEISAVQACESLTTAVGDSLGSAAAGLVENFDALIVDIGDAIDSFERSVIDGTAGY